MHDYEVPQEGNSTLGGLRKAMYASDAEGRIGIVESKGWEVEEIATRQAVKELERLAADAREQVLAGCASPLLYHMYKARMDVTLLSQVSGIWRWRLRRHLRPESFRKLSRRLLTVYAEALGLSVEQLEKID